MPADFIVCQISFKVHFKLSAPCAGLAMVPGLAQADEQVIALAQQLAQELLRQPGGSGQARAAATPPATATFASPGAATTSVNAFARNYVPLQPLSPGSPGSVTSPSQ